MGFYRELEELNVDELINRFRGDPPEGAQYAFVYYQEVAELIRRQGGVGEDFLRSAIQGADSSRIRAILSALSSPAAHAPGLEDLLLVYLDSQDPLIIAEATDGLGRLGARNALERVRSLLAHASPYVRGAVLRFLRAVDPEHVLPVLLKALHDEHFIVRENAADELGELRDRSAIPYLRQAEQDAHAEVREAARTAIGILESVGAQDGETEE